MSQSPKERRQARTRQAILDAARELILEKGVEKLSLRAVARKVDYSPAGLYEYFTNKEAIISTLAEQVSSQLYLALEKASLHAEGPPLVAIGLAYIQFAREHSEDFLLMFSRLHSRRVSEDSPVAEDSPYKVVVDAVASGIQSGSICMPTHMSVEQIAYSVWAMCHGAAMLQTTHLKDFQADFQTADTFAFQTLLEGLAS
ncbi:MAG: TetR/AcrR family transcriptional regulator [Deltaproteobacteria bacterium]|nr:MAG: TetR/AcrR family transcriptional regulator [Deltaproteobacteria bacterium]